MSHALGTHTWLSHETYTKSRRTLQRVSFVCYGCRIPRPFPGARSTDWIMDCYYCTLSSPRSVEGQVNWCSRGEHIEYESCQEHEEHFPSLTSVPEPDTYHDIPPNSGIPPNRGLSQPVDTFSAATLAERLRLPALSEFDYGLLTTFAKAIEVEYPFQ
ncbi:hypothetical protein E4U31_003627, partial [Claviceps sp. LM219 group G6]